jgi:hypothetical protein
MRPVRHSSFDIRLISPVAAPQPRRRVGGGHVESLMSMAIGFSPLAAT